MKNQDNIFHTCSKPIEDKLILDSSKFVEQNLISDSEDSIDDIENIIKDNVDNLLFGPRLPIRQVNDFSQTFDINDMSFSLNDFNESYDGDGSTGPISDNFQSNYLNESHNNYILNENTEQQQPSKPILEMLINLNPQH